MSTSSSFVTTRPWSSATLAAVLLSLTACASAPKAKDAASYVAAPLADAEVMPLFNEERESTKVVVVDGLDGGNALARQAQLGKLLSKSVEQALVGRSFEIVDDALAPSLDDALRKAEAMNTGGGVTYSGPKVAKYAIKPAVMNSTYSAVFKNAQAPVMPTLLGKLAAAATTTGFEHSANVSVVVRVYELPSLRQVGGVDAEGSASLTDARQSANPNTGMALLTEAADDAIRSVTPELLNLFANKGYVVQRRIHNESKASAFQISMGRGDGIKPGDRVELFNLRPNDNPMLKSAPAHEEIPVGTGTVTEMQFTDGSAWIVLDDDADVPKVHRGDLVKPKHKPKTALDKLADKVNRLKF
jgi:hypothetical protein